MKTKLKIAKNKADNLLSLVMENTISKGPTYKAKMDTLDAEIVNLQDKLSKLEAQRNVAQMSANSGEFLYTNIKFAMKYLDQAPPDAQQALLKALIKSITILDDQVELRMYVGQPFEEIACNLPENTHSHPINAPKNKNAPQNDCRALSTDTRDSNGCPSWLPRLDSNQNT